MKPKEWPAFRQLIRENLSFFMLFFLFLLIGSILLSITPQGKEILFFSHRRTAPGDAFFRNFTKMGEELAFIAVLIGLLFYRFRTALYVPFIAIFVTLVSNLTKSYFAQPRPSLFFRNLGIFDQIQVVDGVHLLGGANSFPSGHTMAAFALYTYLALNVPQKRLVGGLLFLVALLVGVSRIYLVQHFLKDVYLGGILGSAIGILFYYLQWRFPGPEREGWNKGLRG